MPSSEDGECGWDKYFGVEEGKYAELLHIIHRQQGYYFGHGAYSPNIQMAVFRLILARRMPQTARVSADASLLIDASLSIIFERFFDTVLPEKDRALLVQAALVEGGKILFRYAFAVFSLMKKRIKANEFVSARQFWATVRGMCGNGHDFADDIRAEALGRADFGFWLKRSLLRSEMEKEHLLRQSSAGPQQGGEQYQYNHVTDSHTTAGNDPVMAEALTRAFGTDMLDAQQAGCLAQMLPLSIRSSPRRLTCVYDANGRDGWSLSTLQQHCSTHAPTLLLMRADGARGTGGDDGKDIEKDDEGDKAQNNSAGVMRSDGVFGVYLTGSLGQPNPNPIGDRNTFLFAIPHADTQKDSGAQPEPVRLDHCSDSNMSWEICINTKDAVVFGGSSSPPYANAMRLFNDARSVTLGSSNTFKHKEPPKATAPASPSTTTASPLETTRIVELSDIKAAVWI